MKLTARRKAAFLAALRKTGSVRAASRLATPGNKTVHGPHTTFRDAMRRDPEFSAAVQEALDEALGALEAEAMRRAVEGYKRPIYQKGQLVGYETVYSDNMLLTLLRARAPETYSDRRDVRVTGAVTHLHGTISISAEDLLLLEDGDRDLLLEVLGRIADAKGEPQSPPMLLGVADDH